MNYQQIVDKNSFKKISNSLLTFTISKEIEKSLVEKNIIEYVFSNSDSLKIIDLLKKADDTQDHIWSAYIKRVVIVSLILDLNKNSKTSSLTIDDRVLLWNLIYESLINLTDKHITASIGSQGFLSIPLYRMETKKGDVDILRLHIWDKILDEHIDKIDMTNFSIHSHKFHARSWILHGEIFNTRYILSDDQNESDLSYFKIVWDNSKYDKNDNNRKSSLVNSKINTQIKSSKYEVYEPGNNYEIKAGEFHKSEVNLDIDITSTLFLFSTTGGQVETSYVLGPKENDEAPKHKYAEIDSLYLLEKLNGLIISNGRNKKENHS